MVELLQQLVQMPTRGGIDPLEPAVDLLERWLGDHDLKAERLFRDGMLVGLVCSVPGDDLDQPGLVLDAPLDTAPFGDPEAWSFPPTSAEVRGRWLGGRGAADSKAGIAVFCHLAAWWSAHGDRSGGDLTLLFDGDEHTGRFGGARAFFGDADRRRRIGGVMIGYPGSDKVVCGSRGFLRATLKVRGRGAHSGASNPEVVNAVSKAARLVCQLEATSLPPAESAFGHPPKLTVTRISGGDGFSVVPDRCEIDVDIRLVPTFGAGHAEDFLRRVSRCVDMDWPNHTPTEVVQLDTWPPYKLAAASPLADALVTAAREVMGTPVPRVVSGPSNIGNYLASLGVDATAGFGVTHRWLHAADEAIDVESLGLTYEVYRRAVVHLLQGPR
jgi:succinyl-diaminopimelate desuccinylase